MDLITRLFYPAMLVGTIIWVLFTWPFYLIMVIYKLNEALNIYISENE